MGRARYGSAFSLFFHQFPGCTLCLRTWNDTDDLNSLEGFQLSDTSPGHEPKSMKTPGLSSVKKIYLLPFVL
ncbi:hypothetical protein PEX1_070960 [Penicillium expansum]|uniref:Uncharacterized protein n=1 Tax=Penicillium expansum TaxID=27334 RepID=A0A0A2J7C8_PENEN|nr:hypothetical protein PEX2_037490 [Penicillium expansum]KGO36138.1 hypothetical protein PEXP_037890 [Penicillium expansum]KGO50598.1 hypothetical protein PEX2_037490 [Penicillium expansum]KGO68193.1 hypothetical protein PEX1_070960 [Penicillium expansum]